MNRFQFQTKHFILIFFLIGFLVYGASLSNRFVWDDEEQILNNSLVHSITNLPLFFRGSTFNTGGTGSLSGLYYKPLMTVFFSLFYTLFGANPFFFHLIQLIFHIVNTCLVFVLFRNFFSPLAFFLSLIFLVHPINVETIVYSSSLQDILYLFFGLISLLFLMKNDFDFKKTLTLSFLILLSLLSKETGIVFIFLSVLYAYLYQKKKLKSLFKAIFISLSFYSVLRFGIAQVFFNKHDLSPITRISFWQRLLTIPKIITHYLSTYVFPKDFSISQHWIVDTLTLTNFYLPLILSISFFIILSVYLRSKPFLFFYSWFILGLGLHLQIFPLDMTVADRWFYLAQIGLLGMVGIYFLRLSVLLSLLATIVLVLFSIRSYYRSLDWKDSLTLYSKDEQITPNSFDLENNLGVALYRAGRYQEAKDHFERSIKIAPFWWTNWNNLGSIHEQEKNIVDAKEAYTTAIKNGQYYLSYENLAKVILFRENNPDEAKKFAENSLKIFPQNSTLWLVLALSDYKLNLKDDAAIAAKNAYLLSPSEQTYYVVTRLQSGQPIDF